MRDSGDGAGDDQADAGAKTYEREQEISLANNAREMLEQIEHALERIDDGTYGICESCGNPIGKLRLQAVPSCDPMHAMQAEAGAPLTAPQPTPDAVHAGPGPDRRAGGGCTPCCSALAALPSTLLDQATKVWAAADPDRRSSRRQLIGSVLQLQPDPQPRGGVLASARARPGCSRLVARQPSSW